MTTIPRRPFGKTGLVVSALGFGGAPIGFAVPDRQSGFVQLVRRALEGGITFFDTAPDYRRSEELLGEALADRRSEVVLATKCGRLQTPNGGGWDVHEDWSRAGVLRTIEASLRRLRTDYLDLVQLHSPPLSVLEEGAAIQGLVQAREAGLVRHLGISADGDVARRAIELSVFETLQVSYSILEQEPGRDVLPAAAGLGIGIIVKQPLANGIPTKRERPEHADWVPKWEAARRMDWTAADETGGRLALALRWLLADPAVGTAIVGTTRPEHIDANVAASSAPPLDAAIVERMRASYASARAETCADG